MATDRHPTTCTILYKILTPAEVQSLPETQWSGTELDRKDGFLHLSTADQLPGTLERFFAVESGVGDTLYLFSFPRTNVDKPRSSEIRLQFDPAIGTVFGHIYGNIDPSTDFTSKLEIKRTGPNGTFELGQLEY